MSMMIRKTPEKLQTLVIFSHIFLFENILILVLKVFEKVQNFFVK